MKHPLPTSFNPSVFTVIIELKKILSECQSILDIGCGSQSLLRFVDKKYSMGIDGHKKSIEESKKNKIHNKYKLMDVKDMPLSFKPKSFDAVVAIDLIEHLKKKDGKKLLLDMEKIAKKKVVILTPNGFVRQFDKENELQEHLSGWNTQDFKERGYKVTGVYGWKALRGEGAELKFKPKILCGFLSEATHYLFTKYYPQQSFSILAVKDL